LQYYIIYKLSGLGIILFFRWDNKIRNAIMDSFNNLRRSKQLKLHSYLAPIQHNWYLPYFGSTDNLSVLLFTMAYSYWLIIDGVLLWEESSSRYYVAINSHFKTYSQHRDNFSTRSTKTTTEDPIVTLLINTNRIAEKLLAGR
jgi:hypothetical protein